MREPVALSRARVVEQGGAGSENLGRVGHAERVERCDLQLLLQKRFAARWIEVPVGPRLRGAWQRVDQRLQRVAPSFGDQDLRRIDARELGGELRSRNARGAHFSG